MPLLNIIRFFFAKRPYLGYFFIGFIGLALFIFIQSYKTFADPDSFYHAKIAVLISEHGIVRDFSWLAFTALPRIYTDHHLLYHFLLVPFVKFFNPLIGIKIATVIINTIFIVLFYHFLKSSRARWPAFFTLILLGSAPFMFRINLAKANGLSLIFVMLILFFILRKKNIWLFFISFIYVFAYGGWPIGILISGVYLLSSALANFILHPSKRGELLYCYIVILLKRARWRPFAAAVAGSAAGLVINPYFPQNLKFYWLQTVQIGLINYGAKIGVGAEWYGFDLPNLIAYSWPLLLFIFFGMLCFAGQLMKNSPRTPPFLKGEEKISRETIINFLFFIIISGIFFVLTLKSRRNTEYAFPFMIIAASFFLKYFYDGEIYQYFKTNFIKILKNEKLYQAIVIFIILMIILFFIGGVWRVKKDLSGGFGFDKYKEAMAIAAENSKKGEIIFHSDWDDWPMLFYHNDYNRYIVGLDATFMYKYDKELYWKWRDITWGDYAGDPYFIIKNDFKAPLIFISDRDLKQMDKYFINDSRYELLYNREGKIYKVK